MRVRRAHQHEPGHAGEFTVIAEEALAEEKAIILEPLLRARRAEARRRRIELHCRAGELT